MTDFDEHRMALRPDGGDSGNDADAEVAAIRADIQQTRARMSHTVEDIGERLNPDRLREQLKHNLHDATIGKAEHMARAAVDRVDETRHSIMDSIRDNPIPAAMVGIGLGWLYLNSRRDNDVSFTPDRGYGGYTGYSRGSTFGGYPDSYRPFYGDPTDTYGRDSGRMSEMKDTVRERGEHLAHEAKHRVSEIADQARERVSDVAERAHDLVDDTSHRARNIASGLARETRYGTHRVEDRFEHALRDSPLAVGAAAVALGLAVGLTAPATRRESELMGPVRDEMLEKARHKSQEVTGRVQEVASRVVEQAENTVKEEMS